MNRKSHSLYQELSRYYDLIYSWKDYRREVEFLSQLISKYKTSPGHDMLEVACGTGKHAQLFKKKFAIVATDIHSGMLNVARKKVKGVMFKQADMVKMNLNRKFDVIVCLFSSIGYVKSYSNLKKTINNFSRHLKPGGVVIIEPWFTRKTYHAGSPHLTVYEDDRIKIARAAVSKVRGILSVIDMHYLIAEANKDVKHFVDRHELGMFETKKTIQFMKQARLETKFFKNGLLKGRGVYLGVKK